MAAPLVNAVNFFRDFGLFDVVLPFLLVFSIMFAILEKTRILGEDKIKEGVTMPKRSLNAMVSFVVAMLVVATNKIVSAINTALPNIVFLAVVIISFLMLVGIFYKEGDFDFAKTHENWVYGFIIIIFILILAIFLDSLTTASGETWLVYGFNYVVENASGPLITSLIFLVVTLLAIFFIVRSPSEKKEK